MTPIAFSPTEAYSCVLNGADLAHLMAILDGRESVDPACLSCIRIRKALACVSFAELDLPDSIA